MLILAFLRARLATAALLSRNFRVSASSSFFFSLQRQAIFEQQHETQVVVETSTCVLSLVLILLLLSGIFSGAWRKCISGKILCRLPRIVILRRRGRCSFNRLDIRS